MKNKLFIAIFALFSISLVAEASQIIYLACPGGPDGTYEVPVCTVDQDYFQDREEYENYIIELLDVYCEIK